MTDLRETRMRYVAMAACIMIALAGAAYVVASVISARTTSPDAEGATVSRTLLEVLEDPYLVVRSLRSGPTHGHVALVPLEHPAGERVITGLRCQRVAASRSTGTGVCLQHTGSLLDRFSAALFNQKIQNIGELKLTGLPSRARLTQDGEYAATTTFLSGHSYTAPGFTTQTLIHDIKAGESHNVAEFTFVLNGEPRRGADITVWGVTFVPGEPRFFATVCYRGRAYLVEGNFEEQVMEAVRVNAECPSLSPDGKHLVYKKRKRGESTNLWRFHVLDLSTGEERKLAETRSIDDQVAWLDNEHILYGVPERPGYTKAVDIWVAPIDGGEPRLYMEDAASPTVVRPTQADHADRLAAIAEIRERFLVRANTMVEARFCEEPIAGVPDVLTLDTCPINVRRGWQGLILTR